MIFEMTVKKLSENEMMTKQTKRGKINSGTQISRKASSLTAELKRRHV